MSVQAEAGAEAGAGVVPVGPRPLPYRAGWQELEDWLDTVVRLHADDPEGLRAALRRQTGERTRLSEERAWQHTVQWTEAMVRQIVAPGPEAGRAAGAGDRLPGASRVSAPHWLLLRRLAEIHTALKAGTLPPRLLATPTTATGGLDPAELVSRIEGYEHAGAEAMPADLQQALLRLPREIAPEVRARAALLASEAGVATARWMGRRPEPETGVGWFHGAREHLGDRAPGGSHEPSLVPRIRAEPTGLELVDRLLSDPRASRWQADGDDPAFWPATMPSDREVVALHYLPHLLCRRHGSHVRLSEVEAVALTDGPVGEGVALLVAHCLLHGEWRGRESGVKVLLDLTARDDLPAAEIGRQLGLLLRRTWFKPAAVRRALEFAAAGGARDQVWRIMTGFLPVHLPGPGERAHAGHTRMLAFALQLARSAGAKGALPCVAELAAREGATGLVREARRLHAHLS
ncbi:DUF6493 family protein [Nonomuraea sp. NPDC048916]|uniref:DUF7824 domain-containing protein n=1 Tax=Nonomuraea sp. NPDC048916 TaxID=3154232 RepID=UPI0033EB5308